MPKEKVRMKNFHRWGIIFALFFFLWPIEKIKAQEEETLPFTAPSNASDSGWILKTNALPWFLTIANVGAEYAFAQRWSVALDVWLCPWKISDKFSVKTIAVLPECRWWLKNNRKGSFFNLHLNLAWFNVRANAYRYQDHGRPLLGAGIGYGYRLEFNPHWGMEFEIGVGMANTRYDRFYNVDNGALKDTRVTTYWGLDRAAIAFTYYISDL